MADINENKHSTLTSLFDDIADAIRTAKGETSETTYVADKFDEAIPGVKEAGHTEGYAEAKTEYEPKSATLSNAGALAVKNAGGTTKYTTTFTNSYDKGVSDTKVGTAVAADVRSSKTFTNASSVGISGSMPDAVVTSGSATASISDPSYNSTSGKFDLTASGTVAAPTVGTAGYISSTEGTKNTNSVSGSKSLDKISIKSTNSGDSTKTPSIDRQSFTISGVTDAASGASTTTAPTSGVYVKVKSAANTGTLSSTASVASAGYGTTSQATIASAATTTVGANASADTYVPITTTTATTPNDTITTNPTIVWDSTNKKIKASYNGGKNITPTVPNAGWVSNGTSGLISTTGSTSIDPESLDSDLTAANIKDGVTIFDVTGTFTDSSTVSSGQSAASAANILTGKSAFLDGAEVKGTMANNGTVTKTLTTQGASYTIPAGYHSGSGKVTASLTATTLDNTIISGEAVEETTGDYGWKTTVEVPTGYHNAQTLTKTFSEIFPAPETPATASQMLAGYQAYNKSGVLMTGTMPNNGETGTTISTQGGTYTIPSGYTSGGTVTASINNGTITSGAGSATISDPSYNSTSGKFDQTASGIVAAPTVGTAGYVSSTAGTKNTNTISGSKSLAKIAGSTSVSGTAKVTPAISRQAFTISGVTDAASGDAVTTAPTSGVYVKVNSAAAANTLTITPSVTTAGYGTSAQHSIAGTTASVGANASADTYVPIKTGTTSKTDATASAFVSKAPTASASVTTSGIVTSTTDTGYSMTGSASSASGIATASVTASSASVTAGYTSGVSTSTTAKSATSTEQTASDSKTIYIQKGALSASVSSNTAGSASMSTNMSSPSSGTTDYYVTLSTTAGSVKAKASVGTEGYVKSETAETSATSVSVSGNGTKKYITAGAIAASGSVTTSGSGNVNPGTNSISKNTNTNVSVGTLTTTKPSSGYYVAADASTAQNTGSISVSGTGTASATVSTAGYVPSTLTGSGSVSGSGSASVTVPAKSASTTYFPITTGVLAASGSVTTSGSGTVAPGANTISKNSATNVSSSAATTTKPSSGYYVAVDASTAAGSGSVSVSGTGTANATVSTAGYVTTSQNATGSVSGSGSASVTVSAKSASTTYVPITSATPKFDGGAPSISSSSTSATGTNITISDTDTDPGSGIKIVTSGAATPYRAAVLYNGAVNAYVVQSDNTTASAAATGSSTTLTGNTYYATAATLAANKSFTLTMAAGATLNLVDQVNSKTWVIKTDSASNALTIVQA